MIYVLYNPLYNKSKETWKTKVVGTYSMISRTR